MNQLYPITLDSVLACAADLGKVKTAVIHIIFGGRMGLRKGYPEHIIVIYEDLTFPA